MKFERQPLNEGGWIISTDLLKKIGIIANEQQEICIGHLSLEQIETVLLAVEQLCRDEERMGLER